MTAAEVEHDFAEAQLGRGACLLDRERARRLLRFARQTDQYARSMESFRIDENGDQTLELDWSMLALGHDELRAQSPDALNDIAQAILADTEALGLTMLFSIWLAPCGEYQARG